MLEGLDHIDWRRLCYAYGPAVDVPSYIRRLASSDQEDRMHAYQDLVSSVNHQGDIMSATPQVVPFLIELLHEASVLQKDYLIFVLLDLVRSCNSYLHRRKGIGELQYAIKSLRMSLRPKAKGL